MTFSPATQEDGGKVLGRITDPSGAAVAGANVEAVNTATNVSLGTESNEAGNYQIPFLLPGDYQIRVQKEGFRTIQRQNVRDADAAGRRGGGTIKTRRVLDYRERGNDQRRACRLYLSIMDRMGVRLDGFGDADRRLADLRWQVGAPTGSPTED